MDTHRELIQLEQARREYVQIRGGDALDEMVVPRGVDTRDTHKHLTCAVHGHADAAKGALVLAPGGPVGIAGAPAGASTPTVIAAAFKDASAQTCTTMT